MDSGKPTAGYQSGKGSVRPIQNEVQIYGRRGDDVTFSSDSMESMYQFDDTVKSSLRDINTATATLTRGLKTGKKDKFKVNGTERWWMLGMYCAGTFTNSMLMYSYSPLPAAANELCGREESYVLMVQIYLFAYVLTGIIASCFVEVFALGPMIRVAGWIQAFGAVLRCVGFRYKIMAIIGQAITGVCQGFFVNTPSELTVIWFPMEERLFATNIAVNVNTLGISGAYFLVFITTLFKGESDLETLKFGLKAAAVQSIIIALAYTMLLKDGPNTLPSRAAEVRLQRLGETDLRLSYMGAPTRNPFTEPLIPTSNISHKAQVHQIQWRQKLFYVTSRLRLVTVILIDVIKGLYQSLVDVTWPTRSHGKIAINSSWADDSLENLSPSYTMTPPDRSTENNENWIADLNKGQLGQDGKTSISFDLNGSTPNDSSNQRSTNELTTNLINIDKFTSSLIAKDNTSETPTSGAVKFNLDKIESEKSRLTSNSAKRADSVYAIKKMRSMKSFRVRGPLGKAPVSRLLSHANSRTLSYSNKLDPYGHESRLIAAPPSKLYPWWFPDLQSFSKLWKKLLAARWSYLAVCLCFAASECIINQFSSDIGSLLVSRGFTRAESLVFGSLFVVMSLIGSGILGYYVEQEKIATSLIFMTIISASACCMLSFLDYLNDFGFLQKIVFKCLFVLSVLLNGAVVGPIQGFCIELATEVAFPFLGENLSSTVVQIVGNFLSSLTMGIVSPFANQSIFGVYLGLLPILFVIPFMFTDHKMRRLRHEKDMKLFEDESLENVTQSRSNY